MKSFTTTIPVLVLILLLSNLLFAQQSAKPKAEAAKSEVDPYEQLLNFSRPGKHHQVIGSLSGRWAFQDAKRTFVKGTLIRKTMYNDRFYNVEITSGKLEVPVANGKMVEEAYQGMQLEGMTMAVANM